MDNSHLHLSGPDMSTPQFMDANFAFHAVVFPEPRYAPQGIGRATGGELEGKMELDPRDMLPFNYRGHNREGHQSRQTRTQANMGQDLNDGRDLEMRNAPAILQSVEGNGMEDVQLVSAQAQNEPQDSSRAARDGSQIPDGRYDEFGMHNPTAADGSDLGKGAKGDDKIGTPAWTELKTKAGKERKRLPLACIACRRKKIRCSGEKPACKHCLRSRIPCVYKVTTRKAAPRTDYMAMLDKRLKRMEERIIKIIPKEEQDATTVVRAQVKPTLPGTAAPTKTQNKKRPAEEASSSELEAWAGSTRLNGQGLLPTSLEQQEDEDEKLLKEGKNALPTKEIQEYLAEVFFDNLYGQAYHVLHKPSYMRKLKSDNLPPVLVLAVCAVSARFSTHPKVNSQPAFLRGESWAAEARRIVLNRYEWPNITILTCLLLLGLHEFGTCYGGRSWALGGMAIRMAYALQLHRDLDHDPCKQDPALRLSFVDREIRRRTMWACFLMDRFNSSGTDRPMFIKEETVRVQLPIKEKLFQLDMEGPTEDMAGNVPYPCEEEGELSNARENMGVAAYIIRSIGLWGRIVIFHFQGGRERDTRQIWEADSEFGSLKRQTLEFVASLPDNLKFSEHNINAHESEGLANQFLFLHITSQQNVLTLNHNACQPGQTRLFGGGRPRPDLPRDFIITATQAALEAAKKISEFLRAAEGFPVTAPFAGYCAFLSSSVQMQAAFSKDETIKNTAKRNLTTNVRYLTKVKRHWGSFHWTSEQLKKQFKACADAANRGQGGIVIGAPVTMYGDWFDRYPHGVSQSDFEDPAFVVKQEKGDDAVLEHKSDLQSIEQFFREAPQTGLTDGKGKKRKMATAQAGTIAAAGATQQTTQSPLAGQPNSTASPSYLQGQQRQAQQQGAKRHNRISIPDQQSHLPQQPYPSHLSPSYHPGPPSQTQHHQPPHTQQPNAHHTPHTLNHNHPSHPAQRQHHQDSGAYYPQDTSDMNPSFYGANQMHIGGGIMPQLDRQLVYGAYAGMEMRGIDMSNAMSWESPGHTQHAGLPSHSGAQPVQGQAASIAGASGQPIGHGHWQESKSAWFMAFNLNPPPTDMDAESFGLGLGGEQPYGIEMGLGMGMGMGSGMPQGGGSMNGSNMGGSNHGT